MTELVTSAVFTGPGGLAAFRFPQFSKMRIVSNVVCSGNMLYVDLYILQLLK